MKNADAEALARIDAYLRDKAHRLQEVVRGLRVLVKDTVPEVRETLNPWGIPTFEFYGQMCYFMVGKHHVTFGFLRGTSLDDPEKLLEGVGKNLRHVKLRTPEDLRQKGLRALVKAAARLNEQDPIQGMPSKRKKS
jgi:hypothetical protein